MSEVVHASPTKDFFISMITRDIALEDCILDLLDNAIDGARAENARRGVINADKKFAGYRAEIVAKSDRFAISDNCGGMSVEQAKNYAFHFGRRRDTPAGAPETVGLYGIGMKRAMFKLGSTIIVQSSTVDESFIVPIDVDEWASNDVDWDFTLEPDEPLAIAGTTLDIVDLVPSVADEFGDKVFTDGLVTIIARDYSLVLLAGFEVAINGTAVTPFQFGWLQSDDFIPVNIEYEDEGVEVEITAGIRRVPSDDEEPGDPERPDTKYFGWFVVCNDRVVLAGNKDDKTVWGDGLFPAWHFQYNGFNGMVRFHAKDPRLLPWTTTKRGVDQTSGVYRRAVARMKEATRPFIDYTNTRKQDLEEAKRREASATFVTAPASRPAMKLPVFVSITPRRKVANISYAVSETDYLAVAKALGNPRMTKKDVGLRTFEFFMTRMAESED